MNKHTPVAPSALTISDISVRQDDQGRYCLNDLHKASGNDPKHKPSNWLRTQQVQDLIAELEIAHIRAIIQKKGVGTFAAKELVYAYAMWISASFSLKVIRAYDALQTQASKPKNGLKQLPDLTREIEAAIERRAHNLSLRQYEYIKQQLRDAIKQFGSHLKGQDLVEFIQHIDLPDSSLIIIERADLWKLTTRVASMAILHEHAMNGIHDLEEKTGAVWYGRSDNK